jgi:hypothetical protein
LAVADQYYGVFRELSQLLLALYRAKDVQFVRLQDALSDPAYRRRV